MIKQLKIDSSHLKKNNNYSQQQHNQSYIHHNFIISNTNFIRTPSSSHSSAFNERITSEHYIITRPSNYGKMHHALVYACRDILTNANMHIALRKRTELLSNNGLCWPSSNCARLCMCNGCFSAIDGSIKWRRCLVPFRGFCCRCEIWLVFFCKWYVFNRNFVMNDLSRRFFN